MSANLLKEIVEENRADGKRGIYSICSSHSMAIEASLLQARADASPLLIEATCNQVNPEGGYTGMTPQDFAVHVRAIAERLDFPRERLILGADHLGPSPWRSRPVAEAMAAAKTMVADYVRAGFAKIHLDASMGCGGDVEPLADETVAERATELCAAAEAAIPESAAGPLYVIGTEVPASGGSQQELQQLAATRVEDLNRTIETHRRKFAERGLEQAWQRVIGVVVQPGVEFGHAGVLEYQPEKAQALSKAILGYDGIVYEAHSTDYQTEAALRNLVADHFAILKVGPALTHAAREALFALSYIEQEWISDRPLSNLRQVLERQMLKEPKNWDSYYAGSETERAFARKYSFSDRSRYYWADPEVEASVQVLLKNLSDRPAPMTVLSQFMPNQYAALRAGALKNDPHSLIRHRIQELVSSYARASGLSKA